eukprot:9519588-Alexandrium_andersonii.AAC.1
MSLNFAMLSLGSFPLEVPSVEHPIAMSSSWSSSTLTSFLTFSAFRWLASAASMRSASAWGGRGWRFHAGPP